MAYNALCLFLRQRPNVLKNLRGDRETPRRDKLPCLKVSGAPVKHVGEPCAGEVHARFDGGGWKRHVGFGDPRAEEVASEHA